MTHLRGFNYLLPDMSTDRWWNCPTRGRQPEEFGRSLEAEALNQQPLNITVCGHSFIRRLELYAIENFGHYHNFRLEHNVAHVTCIGISGLTVQKLINSHLHAIVQSRPDIVYLEIGTNDLADPNKSAREVGDGIKEVCTMLRNLGVKRVVVGEVTFRVGRGIPYRTPDFNYKVLTLNRYLQVRLDEYSNVGMAFWRHKYLWQSALQLYVDGVHYTKDGNKRLFRSIRGALLKSMWVVRDGN